MSPRLPLPALLRIRRLYETVQRQKEQRLREVLREMRAAIDTSYDALTPDERSAFDRGLRSAGNLDFQPGIR